MMRIFQGVLLVRAGHFVKAIAPLNVGGRVGPKFCKIENQICRGPWYCKLCELHMLPYCTTTHYHSIWDGNNG